MARVITAADRKPELLVDRAVDHLAAGAAAPESTKTDETELQIWAATALAHFGDSLPVASDPVERDRVLRVARERWGLKPKSRNQGRWWKVALWIVLGVVALSAMFAWRSQSALPGDRLWEVKRLTEGFRQWTARGQIAETERAMANTRERLREARALIAEGQQAYAKAAIFEFYREFEEVRWRLRDLSEEREPAIFAEADRQLAEAVDIENHLTSGEASRTKPVEPVVGTRSPTPRPPWLAESSQPSPANT